MDDREDWPVVHSTGWVRAALVVALVVAASGCSATGSPSGQPPTTLMTTVDEGPSPDSTSVSPGPTVPSAPSLPVDPGPKRELLSDDGQVEVAAAEEGFAAAFGGTGRPTFEVIDGSGPLRWAMTVWDELRPKTRDAVSAVLRELQDPFAEASGFGPAQDTDGVLGLAPSSFVNRSSVTRTASQPLTSVAPVLQTSKCVRFVDGIAVDAVPAALADGAALYLEVNGAIAAHLGRTAVDRTSICLFDSATAAATSIGRVFAADGAGGVVDHCGVWVSSAALANLERADLAVRLAYASMSCWMATARTAATVAEFYETAKGAWWMEGATMWAAGQVAVTVAGGTGSALDDFWETYLTTPKLTLTSRLYDAMGWFAQVEMAEHEVWAHLDGVWSSRSTAEAWTAAQSGDQLRHTWPAGYAREPNRGADWDIEGTGITGARPDLEEQTIGDGATVSMTAPALAVDLGMFATTADVIAVTSTGTLRISDGQSDLQEVTAEHFCTRPDGDCVCPENSEPIGEAPAGLSSPFRAGLASGLSSSASATFTGLSLATFCRPVPPDSDESSSDACALVTDAEVQQLLGLAIARHELFDDGIFQTCVKGTARQPLDGMSMSDISYVQVAVGTGSLAMLHDGSEDEGPTTPLEGLGDAAELIDGAGAVVFDHGSLVILVQVVQAGLPAPTEVVVGIARLALSRLG